MIRVALLIILAACVGCGAVCKEGNVKCENGVAMLCDNGEWRDVGTIGKMDPDPCIVCTGTPAAVNASTNSIAGEG